jgi:hypothetical protein
MIRLKITMNSGAVTRDCQTQQEADEYLAYISANHNWGKPGYFFEVSPIIINEDGSITEATYELIPAEYTVEQTDITNEYKLNKIRELRKPLMDEADILVNIAYDKTSGIAVVKAYRQALRDCTNDVKADMSLLDEMEPADFEFPAKP